MLGNYNPVSLDPSGQYDSAAWTILHLLGDGLLAFKPVGGISNELVPDLAKSIPIPTNGGRSYTFDLRPGISYSNGESVAAIDFRRGIERVFLLEPYAAATSSKGSSEVKPVKTSPERATFPEGSRPMRP